MTSTETATATSEPEAEARGWDWMDTAGLIAGGILLLILADVFTDGRLISRRLRGRREVPDASTMDASGQDAPE